MVSISQKARIDAVDQLKHDLGTEIDTVSKPQSQGKTEENHDYRVDVHFDKVKAETAMKARES
jgi:hypothetical protein